MDERELVARLAARDPEAFAALQQDYVPRLLRHATKQLHSPQEAEDAVYAMIAKWATGSAPVVRGPLVPFLLRSVDNAVVDARRLYKKQTGQHPRTPVGTPPPPDRRLRGALVEQRADESDAEYDEVCTAALESLSANDRAVLEMSTRTMSAKEKATEMKKKPNAYAKQLHDARGRLVKAVEVQRARRGRDA
jgi:DNA-directed RNA polymerase specialized sigma24 family protein